MWGNGLSLLEHNVAPNQICAAGDWLVRNADLFPREGYLSIAVRQLFTTHFRSAKELHR
jgi:hypothetical protein